mgnify:CR=1 FL=1
MDKEALGYCEELTVEKVLEYWREYEKVTIARDQSIADYSRKNSDQPK